MIKFAVTRPKDRLESIKHGTDMLKWSEDRYLQYFGLRVDPNMTQVCLISSSFYLLSNFGFRQRLCSSQLPISNLEAPNSILVPLADGISVARSSLAQTQLPSSHGALWSLKTAFLKPLFRILSMSLLRHILDMAVTYPTRSRRYIINRTRNRRWMISSDLLVERLVIKLRQIPKSCSLS